MSDVTFYKKINKGRKTKMSEKTFLLVALAADLYCRPVVLKLFILRTTKENICLPKYQNYERCYRI